MTADARQRLEGERGMVTAFIAVASLALILLAGLVVDGGAVLAARARAVDEAQAAARAGAQHLDLAAYRTNGTMRIDPDAARDSVEAYLAAAGHEGSVEIDNDQVRVTVTIDQPLTILAADQASVTVTGTGSARATRGVQGPLP